MNPWLTRVLLAAAACAEASRDEKPTPETGVLCSDAWYRSIANVAGSEAATNAGRATPRANASEPNTSAASLDCRPGIRSLWGYEAPEMRCKKAP